MPSTKTNPRIIAHIEHHRDGVNDYNGPRYHSVVKTEAAPMMVSHAKTKREHKDDLYFLKQLFKANNVKL